MFRLLVGLLRRALRSLLFFLWRRPWLVNAQDVQWRCAFMADSHDVGVRVGGRFFILYKAESLEYSPDEPTRPLEKRELGECIHGDPSASARWITHLELKQRSVNPSTSNERIY